MIKDSDIYRENADNCLQLAEASQDEAAYNRYIKNGGGMARVGRGTGLA